ncbi:MAG: ATP-binding protein [Elusimicrobiota bacterium]|jgi:signal transduction histidine kinase
MPKDERESLELLLEVGTLLSSKLDLGELLQIVMGLASRVVDAETASLLLLDPQTDELYFDVALGLDPEVAKIRLKKGQGIAGAVAQEARSVIVNDVASDPRWSKVVDQNSGFITRSVLAAPILLKGKVLGVVEAINSAKGSFSPEDLRIFEAFASQAAVAIDNARLFSSLRTEKAKLDTLLNEMADAAVLTDEKGRILFSNSAAQRFFAAGSNPPPADLRAAVQGLEACPSLADLLSSKERITPFELVRKAPQPLVLAGTVSSLHDPAAQDANAQTCRVFVFRDVTEERHEEGLKRNFLSLISHKLKTPLASIVGYGQLLCDDLGPKTTPTNQRALQSVLEQGRKLALLVDKLLNYTVLESLDSTLFMPQPFPVDEILQEAVKDLSLWIKEKKGTALVEPGSGLKVLGDRILMRDCIKNLIENGIKFAPEGKRRVALWAGKGPDGRVEVRVRDTGPGIAPEEQTRVFRKFYQVESSFTGQVDGWGLGLSFVHKVVKKHGGDIRLESQLGAGTTVTIILPPAP